MGREHQKKLSAGSLEVDWEGQGSPPEGKSHGSCLEKRVSKSVELKRDFPWGNKILHVWVSGRVFN